MNLLEYEYHIMIQIPLKFALDGPVSKKPVLVR